MIQNHTEPVEVKVILTGKDVSLPVYASPFASGADLCAYLEHGTPLVVASGQRVLVPTGLRIAIPEGYEAQVRPRSGLALKYGVTVLNAPGTIDSDYRGDVGVVLINLGEQSFAINHGDRIAQLVIAPVIRCRFVCTTVLEETERGEGGFGSTGV